MTIRYSWWKLGLIIVGVAPLAIFWSVFFLVSLFMPLQMGEGFVDRVVLLGVIGSVAFLFLLPVLHFTRAFFQGRILYRFGENEVTRFYGLFRQKKLVIPYKVLSHVSIREKDLKLEVKEEFGSGGEQSWGKVLQAASAIDTKTELTAQDVLSDKRSYLSFTFVSGSIALQYARAIGIKRETHLQHVRESRSVDIRYFLTAPFDIQAIQQFILERKHS